MHTIVVALLIIAGVPSGLYLVWVCLAHDPWSGTHQSHWLFDAWDDEDDADGDTEQRCRSL